jgi:DNA-binding XRE family transcriptional regulator
MKEPKTQDINSKVLKEARKALKMNQQELAEMIGSHQTDISKLENGKKIPDWLLKSITLGRLLEKAGYSLNDLILSLPDPDELPEVKP